MIYQCYMHPSDYMLHCICRKYSLLIIFILEMPNKHDAFEGKG